MVGAFASAAAFWTLLWIPSLAVAILSLGSQPILTYLCSGLGASTFAMFFVRLLQGFRRAGAFSTARSRREP